MRIAIDDFGSGYAYRADLQKMPIDFLKVDRASLDAGEDEDYRSWLLEAILVFGRDLSLTVIAKGVESQDQVDALQSMGATMAQGFFLGEPVPAEGVGGLFRRAGRRRAAGDHSDGRPVRRRLSVAASRSDRAVGRTPARSGPHACGPSSRASQIWCSTS